MMEKILILRRIKKVFFSSLVLLVDSTFVVWWAMKRGLFETVVDVFFLRRQLRHRRRQAQADPRTDMDAHLALLNLHAHVGGRGRERQGSVAEAATAALDPEQDSWPPHQQLHVRLEWRPRRRSPGRRRGSRYGPPVFHVSFKFIADEKFPQNLLIHKYHVFVCVLDRSLPRLGGLDAEECQKGRLFDTVLRILCSEFVLFFRTPRKPWNWPTTGSVCSRNAVVLQEISHTISSVPLHNHQIHIQFLFRHWKIFDFKVPIFYWGIIFQRAFFR